MPPTNTVAVAEQKLAAIAQHGVRNHSELAGHCWKTCTGEWRLRAPWRSKHGMIWATVELIEPVVTTVVENPDAG